jgi:hypothetical protein
MKLERMVVQAWPKPRTYWRVSAKDYMFGPWCPTRREAFLIWMRSWL